MKGKQGFTLLELLMVVIIIAILASIALPQYIKASEKSRIAEAIQTLGAIRTSEGRYRAQSNTNSYTGVITDLDIGVPATWDSWNTLTLTVSGAGLAAKGVATLARAGGVYNAQTYGITLGSGTNCGTFVPAGVLACVAGGD